MAVIRHKVVDGKVIPIHKVVVHRFNVGDCDDPVLYAASPLYHWEKSEAGQFIMEFAEAAPIWHQTHNVMTMGYEFAVVAEIEEKKLSEYYLRFGKINGTTF